jgi:hypothetical protein
MSALRVRRLAYALLLQRVVASKPRPVSPGIRLMSMHTFDLRRTLVPFSLLEMRQRFKEMRSGDSMVVLWGDVDSADDLLRILPASSFDVVSQTEIPGNPAGLRMELTKK